MTQPRIDDRKPLRLWPGVLLVVMQWLVWLGAQRVVEGIQGQMIGAFGAMIGGLLVVVWWLFFSRARWSDRGIALLAIVFSIVAARVVLHESIRTAGMGIGWYILMIPWLSLAFVLCVVFTRRLPAGTRRMAMVATIVAACGAWALLRTEGVSSTGSTFAWRWAATPEERLLASGADDPVTATPASLAVETTAEWPGFRGPERDGVVPGVRIATDWSASPPVELWRRPVGPAWSSFAVQGGLIYTQEQRGDDEVVSCYDATTGEPLWRHRDRVRFWESNAGAGPRGTPALAAGRVITLGATGLLNVLDAAKGALVWSRDVAADTGARTPYWGFSGSPLVIGDTVLVAAGGQLAAYDFTTGEPRWSAPDAGAGYSSPHRVTIAGIEQVVLVGSAGARSVVPSDGRLLWEHAWEGYPIVQPAVTADGDLLIAAQEGSGLRRLAFAHEAGTWTIEERWTSSGLKPYYSDFVVHDGHAYGFDGNILACIGLDDGERRWKGGRYGNGQLLLLPDQNVLLVTSERGELVLVEAAPGGFTELTRFPGVEGKTWNHPVLVGDLLLMRNDREMVAFRLPLAGRAPA